jgi:hypothetical protein
MTCNPSARLLKGFVAQPEMMDAPFYIAFHYPSLFQHFQVFGNCGLSGAESAAKFARALGLAMRQSMNHRSPCAVGQSVKCEEALVGWLAGRGRPSPGISREQNALGVNSRFSVAI